MKTIAQERNHQRKVQKLRSEGFSGVELARRTRTLRGYVRNRLLCDNRDVSNELTPEEIVAVNWDGLVEEKRQLVERLEREREFAVNEEKRMAPIRAAEAAKEAELLAEIEKEGVLLCDLSKEWALGRNGTSFLLRCICEMNVEIYARKIRGRWRILSSSVEHLKEYAVGYYVIKSESAWRREGLMPTSTQPIAHRQNPYSTRQYAVYTPSQVVPIVLQARPSRPRISGRRLERPVAADWKNDGF